MLGAVLVLFFIAQKGKSGGTSGQVISPVIIKAPSKTLAYEPWKPLFKGDLKFLNGNGRDAWKVEKGALVNVPGKNNSAQTRFSFDDGQFRIRFEIQKSSRLYFNARQGHQGGIKLSFNKSALKKMGKGPHEVVFTLHGTRASARLNGKDIPIVPSKNPLKGCMQFNCRDGQVRILSMDFRAVKK